MLGTTSSEYDMDLAVLLKLRSQWMEDGRVNVAMRMIPIWFGIVFNYGQREVVRD